MDGPPDADDANDTVAVDAPVDDEDAGNAGDMGPPDNAPPSPADPKGDGPARKPSERSATTSVPEPPRWRFVNVAKKSLGYSSAHAGSLVEGLTSDELGARYAAPELSADRREEGKAEVRKSDRGLPSGEAFAKEDVEVGRLSGNVPAPDAFRSEGRRVGKLDIEEAESSETALPTGTFAGLPKAGSPAEKPRKPFREWETKVNTTPKEEQEGEWHTGDVEDRYKMPGDEGRESTSREVGRIELRLPGEAQETFAGEIAGSNRLLGGNGIENSNAVGDGNDAREGALLFPSASADATEKDSRGTAESTIEEEEKEKEKKRRYLYFLLLVPLLLGAVLGAVLGRDGEQEKVVAGALGVIPPVLLVANETSVPSTFPSASPVIQVSFQPSIQQSSQPSQSPSTECPEGTAPFSIEHPNQSNSPPWGHGAGFVGATWRIRDVCSGEVVDRCLPCATQGFQSEARNRRGPSGRAWPGGAPREDAGCLPAGGAYVLEVGPEEDPNECCAFDPAAATFSYGNVAIKDAASEPSYLGTEATTHYFGEGSAPCPSPAPSAPPSCPTDRDFNLCVAVDMSGSVCNDGGGSECLECRAQFLPSLFKSPCRDDGVDEDTCCDNFSQVKEFSSLMVRSLGDSPVEKSFSVVQFSTDARAIGGLSSAEETVAIMEGLDYTGGLTNHKGAIEACQETLPMDGSRKNFIMLVTDGVASVPRRDPSGEAEDAARAARADGTFIIPVFISPYNDSSALMFMRRLSSDGKVFYVTEFGSLNGLQDQLIDQVSCS